MYMLRKRYFSGTTPFSVAELPWRYSISTSFFHDQKIFHMAICIKIDSVKFKREVKDSLAVISAEADS